MQFLAKKRFDHTPRAVIGAEALRVFSDSKNIQRGSIQLPDRMMRRKRSLMLLGREADMRAVQALQAYREWFAREFGDVYTGVNGQFDYKGKSSDVLSRMLGAMEVVSQEFTSRKPEMDLATPHQSLKIKKVVDALMWRGNFSAEDYESGRRTCYRKLIATLGKRKFVLLGTLSDLETNFPSV